MAKKSDEKLAPKESPRPRARPKDLKAGQAVKRGNSIAKRIAEEEKITPAPKKKAKGGKVRGMGAAKRGGKFTRSG